MADIDTSDTELTRRLQILPLAAGLAVGLADTDDHWYATGFASFEELHTLVAAPAKLAGQFPGNTLIAAALPVGSDIPAMLAHLQQAGLLTTDPRSGRVHLANPAGPEHFIAGALDRCREVVTALAGQPESLAYRQWVLAVAQAVAEASSSGGFFGLGAKRVSRAETRVLDRLAEALQVAIDGLHRAEK